MRWRDCVRAALIGGCAFGMGVWLIDLARTLDALSEHSVGQIALGLGGAFFSQLVLVSLWIPILTVALWMAGGVQRIRALLAWPFSSSEEGSEHIVLAMVAVPSFALVMTTMLLAIPKFVASDFYRLAAAVVVALALATVAALVWSPLSSRLHGGWLGLWGPSRRAVSFAVLAIAGLLAALVLRRAWSRFSLLPWDVFVQFWFAGGFVCLVAFSYERLRVRQRHFWFWVGYALLTAMGVSSALFMSPRDVTAVKIAREIALAGVVAEPFLRIATDFDGDGQLSYFGGGDCAPHDPMRYLGAVDVPENGKDEDCSGEDLTPLGVVHPGRMDWPIPSSVPKRFPIVLITIDALSPKHLSGEGYPRPTSPNLDALITQSAYFASAFAQGPSTRLSFPSFFTSYWDSQLEWDLKRRQPYPFKCRQCQLAEFLKLAGYQTAAVLSEGYFSSRKWPSITRGFDEVQNEWEQSKDRVPASVVTAQSIEILKRSKDAEQDKPLFLWAHYYDVHSPYQPAPERLSLGDSTKDKYDGQVRVVDEEVARLIEAVRAYSGDALVVLASDHATVFHPKPGLRKKKYGYDLHTDTLHVPLLFSAPWIPPARHEGVVTLMDVVPTVMNLVGYRPKRAFYGESLVPELFEKKKRERTLFHQYHLPERKKKGEDPIAQLGVRTNTYNLILNRRRGTSELYAWQNDYHEVDDLLGKARDEKLEAERERLVHVAQSYLYELGVESELE